MTATKLNDLRIEAQGDVLERLVVDACRNWSHNGCNLAADYNGIVLQPYVGLCRVAK